MESEMDWFLLLQENLNTLITVSGTFVGLIVGSVITIKSQKEFFQRQINWEKKKIEDEKLAELLTIYNKILKINGEVNVVEYQYSGNRREFKSSVYISHIRPLLFEKFHLLHLDISRMVKEIDEILLKWNVIEEEGYEGEVEDVAFLYLEIIDRIDSQVNLNRIRKEK